MSLTVLSVAYPFAKVTPDSVGGAEQVMRMVVEGLVRAGHRSLVLAARGSTSGGELYPMDLPDGVLDDAARRRTTAAYRSAVRELVSAGVDVVHMHGVDFSSYLPDEGPALLATLHLPSEYYPGEIFSLGRSRTRFVCVSEHQLATCPRTDLPLCVVPNGVSLDEFAPSLPKEPFVLAMGRICPEKGFHDALDAAKEADVDMILAGEVFTYPGHLRYFSEAIEPRLDARRRFVGPVGGEQKRRLLARARCLLVPSLVAETSSLVTMEALASGTPVIARPAGALGDLVEQGKTGYLVSSVEEMGAAIGHIDAIDPGRCRQAAEARFSADRMIRRYVDLIEELGDAR